MTRKAKVWTFVVVVPFVLLVAAVVALKLIFTSNRLTSLLIPPLENATQRTIKLEHVSLRIFPPIGVEVNGLEVSNRGEEGFSDRPLLELPKLTLDLKLWPLLKNRVEINSIVLKNPRLFLETTKRGQSNLAFGQSPGPASSGPSETGAESPALEALLLANLAIYDGKLVFLDHRENSILGVENLNSVVSAEVLRGGEEVYVESETYCIGIQYGTAENPMVTGLNLSLKQRSTVYPSEQRLEIQSASLNLQEIALDLKGRVTNLETVPNVDLALTSSSADIEELLASLPRGVVKTVEGLRTSGKVHVNLTLQGPVGQGKTPDIRGTLSITDGSIQYPDLPQSMSNIALSSSFEKTATTSRFNVETLTAQLGNNSVHALFLLTDFDNPRVQGSLNGTIDLAEVKNFYPIDEGLELSGSLRAKVEVGGLVNKPEAMKSSGLVDLSNVSILTGDPQKAIRKLTGRVSFNNQNIVAPNISFLMGESDFAILLFVRNYLSFIFEPVADAAKPYARVTMRSNRMDVSLTPSDEPVALAALPIDMDSDVSIGTLNLEQFQFKNVRGSLTGHANVITLKNLFLNTFGGSVIANGTLGLQDVQRPQFDITLDVSNLQAHEALAPFTQFSKYVFGKFSMQSNMRGQLTDALGVVPTTVSGDGKIQIRDGKLEGIKLLDALANSLDIKELKNVEFKRWTNEFAIANGRILLSDVKIEARDADFLIGGSHGMDGSMDYAMVVKLSAKLSERVEISGLAQKLTDALKDDRGRLTLNFRIKGTLTDPVLKLDTEMQKRAAKELIKREIEKKKEELRVEAEKKKKRLEEQAKGEAKDIFDRLFPPKKKKP
ncbi:MAG: AsmA-like C-terminal region-containing protein [Bacteroidota bacterium]